MPEPVAKMVASGGGGGNMVMAAPQEVSRPAEKLEALQDIVALLNVQREMILAGQVYHYVHLGKMAEGRLEIALDPQADPQLAQNLRKFLIAATGAQWMVSVSNASGAPTLAQQEQAQQTAFLDEVKNHPVVKATLALFPGTETKINQGG